MFVKWDTCFEVGFRYFDFPQQMKFNDFQKQTYNLTFEDPEIVYLGCYSDDDGDGDCNNSHRTVILKTMYCPARQNPFRLTSASYV